MCNCEDRPCCGCASDQEYDLGNPFDQDEFAPEYDIDPAPDSDTGECEESEPPYIKDDFIDPAPDSDTGECEESEPPYMEDGFIDGEFESRFDMGD